REQRVCHTLVVRRDGGDDGNRRRRDPGTNARAVESPGFEATETHRPVTRVPERAKFLASRPLVNGDRPSVEPRRPVARTRAVENGAATHLPPRHIAATARPAPPSSTR